jgi:hypothetical protein
MEQPSARHARPGTATENAASRQTVPTASTTRSGPSSHLATMHDDSPLRAFPVLPATDKRADDESLPTRLPVSPMVRTAKDYDGFQLLPSPMAFEGQPACLSPMVACVELSPWRKPSTPLAPAECIPLLVPSPMAPIDATMIERQMVSPFKCSPCSSEKELAAEAMILAGIKDEETLCNDKEHIGALLSTECVEYNDAGESSESEDDDDDDGHDETGHSVTTHVTKKLSEAVRAQTHLSAVGNSYNGFLCGCAPARRAGHDSCLEQFTKPELRTEDTRAETTHSAHTRYYLFRESLNK